MSMATLTNLTGPAMVPPDGVVPDFEHPGGRHVLGYAIVFLGIVVSTLSVIPHLVNRAMARNFGLVEFFLIAAWGQYIAFQVIIHRCAVYPGIGRHQWNYQLKDLAYFLYNVYLATCLYGTCMMCLKLAILIDWLHLFVPQGQRNGMFWAIHIVIWSNVVFFVVGEFADIFQCQPMEKIWNPLYEGGNCPINVNINNFSAVLINLASDLAILALPQWTIWHLNMSSQRKVGISILFAIGVGVCVLGALRLISLLPLINSEDQTFWLSILGIYSSAEMGAGFLVIGLPSVPKVYQIIPHSESLTNLLRSIRGSGSRWTQRATKVSQSIRRPPPKKRRGLWEITELEETELQSRYAGSANEENGTVHGAHWSEPARSTEQHPIESSRDVV